MHVLIATDGTLDPDTTVPFATALAGGGAITVVTVVEINRNLLRDLRELFGERHFDASHQDAEYVGMSQKTGISVGADWPGDDEMLTRYLNDQREARTGPLAAALREAGAEPDVQVLEGEAAPTLIALAGEIGADVVCVGSHGKGLFDGFLGSTSTKLARRSPVPVLIIR